ncbi:serine/threonine-protein kinase Sgk2 [Pochonia chlamydosporia 170]|uniref:Serine/threonine-protein kinase Sgk2 n=1 Tax=Pochonia chlamydosporia 170 TaxID=1380566 RepID=A0A179F2F2_METCM|nr:serine/threonine-protein kinase Sgk2 [Pochonia chlamydosporia 170]OAQ59614.2 serine/threonine-protein kinase Sgk2 [Pochonia chlamydosporia 170]
MKNDTDHDFAPASSASTTDDQDIHDNINGRMHGPMSGFIKKHFNNFQYVRHDGELKLQAAGRQSCICAIPSNAPSPDDFLQWFQNYLSQESDGARGEWHISRDSIAFEHERTGNGTRLLLNKAPSPANNAEIRWDQVQIIGQFYHQSGFSYRDGLLSLCRSAHEVFASQPTRLFLHGFYIRGSFVEFWVFDRSGLYCSDVFDIQTDFIQFLSIILSYQRMTDQDLGELDTIKTDEGGSYMMFDGAETIPSFGKHYLERKPVASREGIVGSGTTCYRIRMPRSSQWSAILKFKWRWARERPEDELLRLAHEKGVWGALSLDYFEEVESTANLRQGIRWGTQRRFSTLPSSKGPGLTLEQRQEATSTKRGFADYTEETNNYFQNRILTCIVTSPVGRPLHTFCSLQELLQVFRDAIKCHKSLYFDAAILHQDVSAGNIIILDGENEESPRGILIDLDSAVQLPVDSDIEPDITGTRPFMAIGVLKEERHTFRHDLESFLYVLLWILISNRSDSPPEGSKLQQWSKGDWDELAARKCLDMGQDTFQDILNEFPREFHSAKPLAESLRRILFPLQTGVDGLEIGETPEDVNKFYDGIIDAFEGAIASYDR